MRCVQCSLSHAKKINNINNPDIQLEGILLSYLCGFVSFSMNEDGGFQVVVGAGPERPLQEGAVLDTRLNLGQRQVLWEKQLTASYFILGEKKNSIK